MHNQQEKALPFRLEEKGIDFPTQSLPFRIASLSVKCKMRTAHIHRGIEIGVITRGKARYYLGGEFFNLQKDDCWIVDAMIPHYTGTIGSDAFTQVHLHLGIEAVAAIQPPLVGLEIMQLIRQKSMQKKAILKRKPELVNLMLKAEKAFIKSEKYSAVSAWGYIMLIVGEIASTHVQHKSSTHFSAQDIQKSRIVIKAMHFVQQNFAKPLGLNQIAEHCCVSQSTLSHTFSRYAGYSPIEYRNKIRIDHAIELLMSEEHKIEHIAQECGFDDPSHFNRLFKKFAGQSPAQLRARLLA